MNEENINECIICLELIDIENQKIQNYNTCLHSDKYHAECYTN